MVIPFDKVEGLGNGTSVPRKKSPPIKGNGVDSNSFRLPNINSQTLHSTDNTSKNNTQNAHKNTDPLSIPTRFDEQGKPIRVVSLGRDLRKAADTYLSNIKRENHKTTVLKHKWNRLCHLVRAYKTAPDEMLYDEKQEMKELLAFDKNGGFKTIIPD